MRKTVLLFASTTLAVLLACGVAMIEAVAPAQAAFPGTNGKIVFVVFAGRNGSDYGIKLINPNGSGLTTLVDTSRSFAHAFSPAMSPNGTRVAYARGSGKSMEIYKINRTNRKITQITDNKVFDVRPTWKPDGTRIAFESERTVDGVKNHDIFVRRADGTGETVNLTKTPHEDEVAPAWSPNGKEIAFRISTTDDIVVLNLETGHSRSLTNDRSVDFDSNLSWSPDGTRIVFVSSGYEDRQGTYDDYFNRIYTIDASDGSDRRLLAQVWYDDFGNGSRLKGAAYSPDGNQIAYVKTKEGGEFGHYSRPQLFKMNASTGANKQLIYTAGFGERVALGAPDWGVKVLR